MTIRRTPVRRIVGVGAIILSIVASSLAIASPADAFWRSTGEGVGSATTGTLNPPTAVTVPATSAGTVAVSWTAPTAGSAPTGYYVTRTTGTTTVAACGTTPTSSNTATSCPDTGVPTGTYTYNVTALNGSWTARSASSASVSVATATKLVFTTSRSATPAGSPFAIAVTVQSAAGGAIAVAGTSVTLAIGTNGGSPAGVLSGTLTATTNSSGVATFAGLSINRPGTYTLVASSAGLTSATSAAISITTALPTAIGLTTSPITLTATRTMAAGPISVVLKDATGATAFAPAGDTVLTLSSTSSGMKYFSGTLGGGPAAPISSITIPAGSSTASFYYADDKAGAPTITVSGTNTTTGTNLTPVTQTETVTAGAGILSFVQGPSNAVRGVAISPAVTVTLQDSFGNVVNGNVAIAIATNPGTALLSVLTGGGAVATVNGIATFSGLSINGVANLAGNLSGYTLQATSPGTTSATSTAFTIFSR